ncbi:hypothetical protein Hdeb2414_s0011g00370691 [Helianthus debilis subsp. tardiflorus]
MVISRQIHQDQSNRSSYYILLFLRFWVFNGDLYTWKFRRCRRWIPSLTCIDLGFFFFHLLLYNL